MMYLKIVVRYTTVENCMAVVLYCVDELDIEQDYGGRVRVGRSGLFNSRVVYLVD